ncbi:hypothetical protein B0O80DRAFT_423971 [Mortierella sp. GBAus27b]|nr:hypothetical protein B0O80DRAFT_423971 [Mortierella sp. GBAus27b]
MEEEITQSFCLDGGTEILNLPCDQEDGYSIIYWDTILHVYPGTQYIKNGDTVFRKFDDTDPDGNLRQSIRHQPDEVLTVVLSSSVPMAPVTPPSGFPLVDHQTSDLPGTSMYDQRLGVFQSLVDMHTQVLASPDVHGSNHQASHESNIVYTDQLNEQMITCLQSLMDEMIRNIKLTSNVKDLEHRNNELASTNKELVADVENLGVENVELKNNVIKLEKEICGKDLQAVKQLALLQNRVQALMTQTNKLQDCPIPRLFIVLPQDTSSWDPVNLFSNRFRLHFLCECGEHTKSENSKIAHYIHLAKHEGYEIKQPVEFFEQYGQYALTILKMLKFQISVAGVAVPIVSHLVRTDALNPASSGLDILPGILEKGISQTISCLEEASTKNDKADDAVSDPMENKELFEGADLRKLESFLEHKDENEVSGNLLRVVTSEGLIKWVCIDHHREIYQKDTVNDFHDTNEPLARPSDEDDDPPGSFKYDHVVEDPGVDTSDTEEQTTIRSQAEESISEQHERLIAALPPYTRAQVLASRDVRGSTVQSVQEGLPDKNCGPPGAPTDDHDVEVPRVDTSDTKELTANRSQMEEGESNSDEGLVTAFQDLHGSTVQASQDSNVVHVDQHITTQLQDPDDDVVGDGQLASHDENLGLNDDELASKNKELVTDVNEMAPKSADPTNNAIELQEAFDPEPQSQVAPIQPELLEKRIQTLMEQRYELYEIPIPRLFIILPQDTSSYDTVNLSSNKFQLYFLCECGEHTKSTNSKIPHHIHLAKHEGYEITRPTEFFEQYGHYALTILRMLKFGISVAGVAVPAVSHLVRTDALDWATESLKALSGNLQKGLDQAIGCLEEVTADDTKGSDGILEQMENNEALEGADLRRLKTFLMNRYRDKVLGNLYRTVTSEGHVKWVCIDHYRENYNEEAVKAFRDTVESMRGSFDENVGSARVHLWSKTQAERFYQALEKSKFVYELDIALDWVTTQSDFKKLRDTLLITNVGALRLDLKHQTCPASDILNRNRRHDPIFDIMRHPSTRSTAIAGAPEDFIERSSLQSQHDEFSNLRYLGIPIGKDIQGIKALLSKTPNLSRLVLEAAGEGIAEVYNAIVEYQTYPITVDYQFCQIRISPPTKESRQLQVPARSVKELLHDFKDRIEIVEPDRSALVGAAAEIFASSEWDGANLLELTISTGDRLGDTCIKNLAATVSWSELRSLMINLRGGELVQILESIQWEHMRKLEIEIDIGSTGTRAMKALMEGRDKEQGQVELDLFKFHSSSYGTVSSECAAQFKSFVASTSIKELVLYVTMTPSDMESVVNSMDVSRLEVIRLWADGYSSSQVDRVLDCLTNAHNLREVVLDWYPPTQEQIQRMQQRGVTLLH